MTFQTKITTKLEKYSIDDPILELKSSVNKEQLNQIVKNLLVQLGKFDEKGIAEETFNFIVGGRILQLTVEEHLELYSDEIDAKEILSEKLVEIEYILSLDAPEPLEAVPHEDWVSCIDANESYIVTGSYDNSIRIFTIGDRKNVATLMGAHKKPVTGVRWLESLDPSQKNELYFVSSGHDEISYLRRFNTKTHKLQVIFAFKGHNRSVNCIDVNDNIVATGSFDKTLRLWSTSLEQSNEDEENISVEEKSIKKSKKQKVRSSDRSIDHNTRSAIMTLTGHQESITGVKWLSNCNDYNSVATCSTDMTICFWDVEVGECKRKLLSAKPLLGIDYSSENNLIVSASCDRHVRIWDARAPDNATAKTAYTSHSAWVSSVAFGVSPNNFISGGYDNLVKLWDLRSTKACLYDMIGHHDRVLDVNWTNSDYVLSGSADATLKIFATKH